MNNANTPVPTNSQAALRDKITANVCAPYAKHNYSELTAPVRKRIDAIMAAVDEYRTDIPTFRGKPLDQYTKDELIEIVVQLGRMQQADSKEYVRQLKVLGGRP